METTATHPAAEALESRCALSREDRLDIFRSLARGGPDGLAAGNAARHCKWPAPTCSFHLKELEKGGLLNCCRHGRSQIYTVNFRAIRALLGHLTEHCCSEEECGDEAPPPADKGASSIMPGAGGGWAAPGNDRVRGRRPGGAPRASRDRSVKPVADGG